MMHCFKTFDMADEVVEILGKLAEDKPEWLIQFTVNITKNRWKTKVYYFLVDDTIKDKNQIRQMFADLGIQSSYRIEYIF